MNDRENLMLKPEISRHSEHPHSERQDRQPPVTVVVESKRVAAATYETQPKEGRIDCDREAAAEVEEAERFATEHQGVYQHREIRGAAVPLGHPPHHQRWERPPADKRQGAGGRRKMFLDSDPWGDCV